MIVNRQLNCINLTRCYVKHKNKSFKYSWQCAQMHHTLDFTQMPDDVTH